jgi:hypothetical protein
VGSRYDAVTSSTPHNKARGKILLGFSTSPAGEQFHRQHSAALVASLTNQDVVLGIQGAGGEGAPTGLHDTQGTPKVGSHKSMPHLRPARAPTAKMPVVPLQTIDRASCSAWHNATASKTQHVSNMLSNMPVAFYIQKCWYCLKCGL